MTKGTKAGAVPGIIIGVLSLPGNYYLLAIKYREEISSALGIPYFPSLQGLAMLSAATAGILTVCGILYSLSYSRLPGNLPFWKAFLFGLVVFAMSRVGDVIRDYPVSHGLVIDNAFLSAPLLLILYPYLVSQLYRKSA